MSTQVWESTGEPGVKVKNGRYRIRVNPTGPNGQRKQKQKTLPEDLNLEEAAEARADLKQTVKRQLYEQAQSSPIITVADYSERWMSRKAKTLAPSTIDRYRTELSHHILPYFGEMMLMELTRSDVADWIYQVETLEVSPGELYSRSSVQSWWRTVRMMFKDAHAEGYLEEDVTYRLDPPDTGVGKKREQRTLSETELAAYVDFAQERSPWRYPEIATLAYTGMRPGEMYGLHWDAVDFPARTIDIRRAAWRGTVRETTKTGEPRVVPMVPRVKAALEIHRERLIEEQHPGLDRGLVFPADHGGVRYVASLRDLMGDLAELCDETDSKVTPHVLRRSLNQILLEKVDRTVLRSWLGHSEEKMTQLYTHVDIDRKRSAGDGLEGAQIEEVSV